MIIAAKADDFRLIRDLLRSGADVDVKDDEGKSALWYAFRYESFEAFKTLLESGADIDFPLDHEILADSYEKLKFCKLVEEYDLFNRIKHRQRDVFILFDAYFSKFPNGCYMSEVEEILREIVRNDYRMSLGSARKLRQFVGTYSRLGQNCYLIVASDLNIRAGSSINTNRLGKYAKGEIVYALSVKGEWIQTDRGWINAAYARRIKKIIPVLQPYLERAMSKVGPAPADTTDLTPSEKPPKPEMDPSETEAETEAETLEPEMETPKPDIPRKSRKRKKGSEAEGELAKILENPTLPKLEAFINKYRTKRQYDDLTKKARERYRVLLLRDL